MLEKKLEEMKPTPSQEKLKAQLQKQNKELASVCSELLVEKKERRRSASVGRVRPSASEEVMPSSPPALEKIPEDPAILKVSESIVILAAWMLICLRECAGAG